MNDVVITYDEKINSENRLKLLIRAIEKNCEGYNEIVIVGDLPEWVQGVIHIGFGSLGRDYVFKNNYRKLKAVCMRPEITDSFYWIDADDILLKFDARKAMRVRVPEYSPMAYRPKGTEKITDAHTRNILTRRGFTGDVFLNKFPMSMSKERLRKTFDDIDFETKYGYCIRTLYANFNRLKPTKTEIEIINNLIDYKTPSTYEKWSI